MILAIDIGNTNTGIGFIEGDRIVHTFRIASNKNATRDELYLLLLQILYTCGISVKEVNNAILCSVFPPLEPVFLSVVQKLIGKNPFVLGNKENFGLEILIDRREELGEDRIVNACAAYNKYKKFSVVVDFGTATTFDIVSDTGKYLGGVIAPGLNLTAESLYKKASKLPGILLDPPLKTIGKNTVDCLKSGLVLGYTEMISGLLRKIQEELNCELTIIATGGLAGKMHKMIKAINFVDEDLTLWGLKYIFYNYQNLLEHQ